MENICLYGDSDSHSSDSGPEDDSNYYQPVGQDKILSADYFGLRELSSSEDDDNDDHPDVSSSKNTDEARVADGEKYIDILIDAYTLSPSVSGPLPQPNRSISTKGLGGPSEAELGCDLRQKWKVTGTCCKHEMTKNAAPQSTATATVSTEESVNLKLSIHPKIDHQCRDMARVVKSPTNELPQKLFRELGGHAGPVNQVQWCRPQFSHLLLSASMDKTVRVWDVFGRQCVLVLNSHNAAVRCASWGLSGAHIVSGGFDKNARITDVETGNEIAVFPHHHYVTSLRVHPQHPDILLTGSFGYVEQWDKRSPERSVRSYSGNFGQVQDLAFLQDAHEFVCSTDIVTRDSADRTIMAWDLNSGAILSNQIYNERYSCPCLRLHPSGHWFVAQTNGNYIAQFSNEKPYKMNKHKRFEGHKVLGYNIGCNFSPDGRYIITGSANGKLVCYDFANANILKSIEVFQDDPCVSVDYHPVLYSTVALSSWNGAVQVWQ